MLIFFFCKFFESQQFFCLYGCLMSNLLSVYKYIYARFTVFRPIIFDIPLLNVNFRCEGLCFMFFIHSIGTKYLYTLLGSRGNANCSCPVFFHLGRLINSKSKNLIIGCIYWHPAWITLNLQAFISLNYLQYDTNRDSTLFLDSMYTNFLLTYNSTPTHVRTLSKTLDNRFFKQYWGWFSIWKY